MSVKQFERRLMMCDREDASMRGNFSPSIQFSRELRSLTGRIAAKMNIETRIICECVLIMIDEGM